MVASNVAPPRISLRNRAFVRSHIYAVWIDIAKPDLGRASTSVLVLTPVDRRLPLPVKAGLLHELRNSVHRAANKAVALRRWIKEDFDTASWFHKNCLDEVLEPQERSFESGCALTTIGVVEESAPAEVSDG